MRAAAGPAGVIAACDACLRRTALIGNLAGWIDVQWKRRDAERGVLALPDAVLLELCRDGRVHAAYDGFDAGRARERIAAAGLHAVCRCQADYPPLLHDLADPPAVLHVKGDPTAVACVDAVAIVGARRASVYALDAAHALGRALALAGVPVVSGLAIGVDSAAHRGAVEGPARSLAVLGCGADVPYPPSSGALYARIAASGAIVSELPPGMRVRRWTFPARNRVIAALSRATVVVEAAERSGSLITADLAADLGRAVAAIPGQITSRLAAGSNGLIAAGATLIQGPQDVLDLLAEFGIARIAPAAAQRPHDPVQRRVLDGIEGGRATVAALVERPEEAQAVIHALAELERTGLIRRAFGGRYVRSA